MDSERVTVSACMLSKIAAKIVEGAEGVVRGVVRREVRGVVRGVFKGLVKG